MDDFSMLLVCKMEENNLDNRWYLDTGCSNHMCVKNELFMNLDEKVNSVAKFGDDRKIIVKEKGKILIRALIGIIS